MLGYVQSLVSYDDHRCTRVRRDRCSTPHACPPSLLTLQNVACPKLQLRSQYGPPQASQLAEVYWMALARDVPFSQYGVDDITVTAAGNIGNCAVISNNSFACDGSGCCCCYCCYCCCRFFCACCAYCACYRGGCCRCYCCCC